MVVLATKPEKNLLVAVTSLSVVTKFTRVKKIPPRGMEAHIVTVSLFFRTK
jgi:hypothetical protein